MENKTDHTASGTRVGVPKGIRHIPLVLATMMIGGVVILHAVGAHSIYKAGAFTLKNPLSYLMIGGLVVVVAFKIKYLWQLKRGMRKDFRK
jgi:hypothetical protein